MDSDLWIQILELVVLLTLSGFFSSAETAMVSVSKIRLRTLEEEGNKKAALALKILENQSKMLSAILIGNNLVNTSAASIASLIAYSFGGAAVSIATFIITFLILVFGEITPKTWATINADKLALAYAPIIIFLMKILTPVIWFVNLFSSGILKLIGIQNSNKNISMTESELRTIVDVSHEEGVIESDERQIINNLFDFGDAEAKDVMIPRIDMVAADITTGYDEILVLFRETMYSRIPVYEEEQDNVVGILYHKDLIVAPHGTQFEIRKIMRKPYYVYEHKNISELFKEMQKQSQGIAIVLDEYGSTAGMITTEDLLEEIVGEIRDEYDNDETEPFVKIDDYTYHIDGTYKLDDVNEKLSTALTSEDNDSIGGYIIEKLDRIPAAGEKLRVDNLEFTVEKVESNRVVSVILKVF